MIELELFFKTVESEIRCQHINYLKKQKCISAAESLSDSSEQSPGVNSAPGESCGITENYPKGEKIKYVKRFNKGIDTALKVLQTVYKKFSQRFETDYKGKRF